MTSKSRRTESTEATRAALIEAARDLFAERGYAEVSTEEIVRAARVSRGALYHHFRDKRDLFRAVFENVDHELVALVARVFGDDDPWESLMAGIAAFLDACVSDQAVRRILFVDAPSVLGWTEWRSLDARHALGTITSALEEAMEHGLIERRPAAPLAHILLGALNEAGMLISNSKDHSTARTQVADTLTYVFECLRIHNTHQ